MMKERISKELADFHRHIDFFHKEIECMKPRRLGQGLFFHRSGRPTKLVRWVAFHKNGRPRGGVLKRIALKKDGTPRQVFFRWMTSPEYAAQPWHAGQSAEVPNAARDTPAKVLSETPKPAPKIGVEDIRGPNPATHPQRYQVWARLDSGDRHKGN
jgi:hypothetical protein